MENAFNKCYRSTITETHDKVEKADNENEEQRSFCFNEIFVNHIECDIIFADSFNFS